MGLPFKKSVTLGGLYIRDLGDRMYAVTHGNAGFVGESHIRFTEGRVLYAPAAGKWTIFVLPSASIFDRGIRKMSAYLSSAERVPEGAAIIATVEIP